MRSLMYGKLYKKEKQFGKANNFFKQRMKEGNIESFYEYGKMLHKGYGALKNDEESIKYFQAMYKYGIIMMNNGKNKSN